MPSKRFFSKKAFNAGSCITEQVDACQRARRRYGEPRLDIWLCVELNSPDCFTVGSIPAKAASLADDEKRDMSPISLSMVAPRTTPIPGMVVSCVSKWE